VRYVLTQRVRNEDVRVFRSSALLLFAMALAAAAGAHAGTEVRVLATYPEGSYVTLGRNQNFYLRIGYTTTDEAVRIWARPYFEGREVNAGSNPSRSYNGKGEALGWFFLMEPGAMVDEVRITAGDGSRDGTHLVATYKVRVTGSDRPAESTGEPQWLTTLKQQDERLQREAIEKQRNTPVSASDQLLVSGFMLTVAVLGFAGIAAPIWAMRRWHGGWRVAAAVPAVMIGFVIARIVVGTAGDPTSHNLWPFEILQVAVLGLVVIGVLVAARKLSGAQA
jgi:hypothetical protein